MTSARLLLWQESSNLFSQPFKNYKIKKNLLCRRDTQRSAGSAPEAEAAGLRLSSP
jgi:hypothetical protein